MDSKDIDVVVIVKTHQGDNMIINKVQAKTDVKNLHRKVRKLTIQGMKPKTKEVVGPERNNKSPVICYNCRGRGHSAKYCKKPTIQRSDKVSENERKFCRPQTPCIEHCVTNGKRHLSIDNIQAIRGLHLPQSKKRLKEFLGLICLCKDWLPHYSRLTAPLYELTMDAVIEPIIHSDMTKNWFEILKQNLLMAPELRMPNYGLPFTLLCHELLGYSAGVLIQTYRNTTPKPIAYYSKQLDPVAKGLPECVKSVIATSLLVHMCADIVLNSIS